MRFDARHTYQTIGVITSKEIEGLQKARATLMRVRDARIAHGWVESFGMRGVSVRFSSEGGYELTDEVAIEIIGLAAKARLRANLTSMTDPGFAAAKTTRAGTISLFSVVGQIQFLAGDPNARCGAAKMAAKVSGHTLKEEPAEILDLSYQGLSIRLASPVHVGQILDIDAVTPLGPTSLRGEVRNVRAGDHALRVGIKLADLGRLDAIRWRKVVEGA